MLQKSYLNNFKDYDSDRSQVQYNTTLLSVYLKYGLISIREVFIKLLNAFGKDSGLLRQLVWKEYYSYLMYNLPIKQTIGGGNIQNKTYQWENNMNYFHARPDRNKRTQCMISDDLIQ